ncbi:hypothetical protein CLI64_21790 [Nostoc sp. CENA543]|uniref:mCpol domain-containing protein n=1 Tax=Nostoc sp. CENA543 TaxID=1869241 RepID=UPI000CA2984B|nr:mCpol domain-containing protein [Nostoc sp. CENA543]AUT02819.1 hypothetical protein CLI64_21790 [Nostoc sp. CENA543]
MLYDNILVCLGDGDNIGNAIEFYLLEESLEAASQFSSHVENAINNIAELVETQLNGFVVYVAGDDICFVVSAEKNIKEYLDSYANLFLQITGKTISFGVGRNSLEALICLRKAKVSGKSRIVIFRGED